MQNHNSKFKTRFWKTYLVLSFTLWFYVFNFPLCASAKESSQLSTNPTAAPASIIRQACSKIYKGDFAAARRLLGEEDCKSAEISRLQLLVSEYEAIEQRRQSAREAAYTEQLAELEKLRAAGAGRVATDANDVNDVNDISKILSVITKACKFAEKAQRSELLSEPFVRQTIERAGARAAQFESEGKWLDAYISCYSWLQAIDEDNETYSDYAEQLITKANIAASFQDSPCESCEERYRGVKKEMFIRAIEALNFNYVSIIDYRQMATEAINRCRLLAEVFSMLDIRYPILDENRESRIKNRVFAWSAALATILDEVEQSPTGMSKDKFIDVFERVLALNSSLVTRDSSLDENRETGIEKRDTLLPDGVLIAQFAAGALSALDGHTVVVWPTQVQDFEKEMTNEFTGIGIEISKEKGQLTVVSLLPDTPAYNSGLDAGDVIEAVDGTETKNMTLLCAVRQITGAAGTEVTLTIRHQGEQESRDITITRARITVPTIRGWQRTEAGKWLYMLDGASKIGYVRITGFSERTAADLEKVLCELEADGLSEGGLVLDLRFNSGGFLNSATAVADKFIEKGLIVSSRPRFGVWTYSSAHKQKTHPNYPLVILVNRYSASASEIVAGALQDKVHKRVLLVGERTHGKGSVQGITRYPGGGAKLKYTMAYYHLPSGQKVESREPMEKLGRKNWGIGPDVEVKLRSDELKEMIDVQRDNSVLVKADHDRDGAPLKRHTAAETLAADPQLAVSVLVVRTKLIEMKNLKNDARCSCKIITRIEF